MIRRPRRPRRPHRQRSRTWSLVRRPTALVATVATATALHACRPPLDESSAPAAISGDNLREHVRLEERDSLLFVDALWTNRDGQAELRVLAATVVPGVPPARAGEGQGVIVLLDEQDDAIVTHTFSPPSPSAEGMAAGVTLRLPAPAEARTIRLADPERRLEAEAPITRQEG